MKPSPVHIDRKPSGFDQAMQCLPSYSPSGLVCPMGRAHPELKAKQHAKQSRSSLKEEGVLL